MSKLDTLIGECNERYQGLNGEYSYEKILDEEKLKTGIKALFRELVGDDIELYGSFEMQQTQAVVNGERAELRTKISEL